MSENDVVLEGAVLTDDSETAPMPPRPAAVGGEAVLLDP